MLGLSRRALCFLGIAAATLVPLGDVASGRTVAVFTVTATGDAVDAVPGDGVCRTRAGTCTLRAALNEASSLASDGTPLAISVPRGTFLLRLARPADRNRDEQGGDLDLFSHSASPTSVTIAGAGAGRTIVEQRLADRVFDVGGSEPVTIANLTIRGGRGVRQGGGVYNGVAGGLTLRGVEIAANSAEEGGGVYSIRPLALDRSRISDNSAERAGGGIVLNTRGGTIAASTVSGNTAQELGGGIWVQNVDSLDVTQSLIADNSVTTPGAPGVAPYGGGIMIGTDPALGVASAVHIASTTIRGNSAGGGGGLAW
jgi:CSLREA domain-containing protein